MAGVAAEPEALRRIHAWVDSQGDPAAKSSYKLPHHRSDGTVVLRGVRAALGALAGARGGVQIPQGDRAGVRAHLTRHLSEFDVEPSESVAQALKTWEVGDVLDIGQRLEIQAFAKGGSTFRWRTSFAVKKTNEELGLVFGWASVSTRADGEVVFDHEGDAIFPEELEKAAYGFVLDARVASDSHAQETLGIGDLVESMFFSVEKTRELGIPDGTVPIGWWVGFHVNDEGLRKAIRDGERSMFSIGGVGVRTEV